jgi:uncharacterized membrane protein
VKTFLSVLHVLAAVFIIGPLVVIPMSGLRAVRLGDLAMVKAATRQTTLYGLLSLLVFAFGAGRVMVEDRRYDFGTPWVTISMTLFVVAIALVLGLLVPSLQKAATLIEAGTMVHAEGGKKAADVTVTARAQDLHTKAELDSVRGRIAASSGVASLLLVLITILMVVKPFS